MSDNIVLTISNETPYKVYTSFLASVGDERGSNYYRFRE